MCVEWFKNLLFRIKPTLNLFTSFIKINFHRKYRKVLNKTKNSIIFEEFMRWYCYYIEYKSNFIKKKEL